MIGLLAHQETWDGVLLALIPLAAIAAILVLAKRRVIRQEHDRSNETPPTAS